MPEIIDAHGKLCELVQKELRMAGGDTVGPQRGRKDNHDEWVVMPLFKKIMIVLDKSQWWLEGVLLVAVKPARVGQGERELVAVDSGTINLEKEEYAEKVEEGVYRVKVHRAFEVVMELQAKEAEGSGEAGLREVGKDENATIGCYVAEWMLENLGLTDYDGFGFREDPTSPSQDRA